MFLFYDLDKYSSTRPPKGDRREEAAAHFTQKCLATWKLTHLSSHDTCICIPGLASSQKGPDLKVKDFPFPAKCLLHSPTLMLTHLPLTNRNPIHLHSCIHILEAGTTGAFNFPHSDIPCKPVRAIKKDFNPELQIELGEQIL